MCSPMPDLPDHCLIGVDAEGRGPTDLEDAVRFIYWCGDVNCEVEPARESLR